MIRGKSKECIAMLLAGGQGSRLKVLTEATAKPAVPFGGKYRIIDFPLSNCVNSGIDTVGIMTQYQPLELNDYIGTGSPWGLDRNFGGVHILPPYSQSGKSEWYKGTANAIYQNINFVDRYEPEYVLVLSGDHIYKMDYEKMLRYHKEKGAQCTIAVLDVPLEEASRFGIMNTRDDDSIYEFEEKPKQPKSTKASMGVYLFDWELLKKYLIDDEANPDSANDFGKNIIPKLLADGKKLFAYQFDGYWKDVGTIASLWEANMDLLDPNVPIELKDKNYKIYARNYAEPPTLITKTADINNSFVAEGCTVKGSVKNSVISTGCKIAEDAIVISSVLMPDVEIKSGAVVKYAIIGQESVIGMNARVGEIPPEGDGANKEICVIGKKSVIASNEIVTQ
ncbi:MAG: glucose-1-phosphate adenylyltransferase [Clostridia bacterium]|nr:glucose-1-phosphate adenylyltransferase [Clostridia bacterium]